jgi:hypothetical protein
MHACRQHIGPMPAYWRRSVGIVWALSAKYIGILMPKTDLMSSMGQVHAGNERAFLMVKAEGKMQKPKKAGIDNGFPGSV